MKMTRKDGYVNVAALARKICGIPDDTPVTKMTAKQKRNFWNVSKVFSKTDLFIGGQKQKTGRGMKMIEKFVMDHV